MKATVSAILAGLALLLATLHGAQAAVVVAFSAPGDAYGWCAGYAEQYAESCAQRQCASSGGTNCQVVADCPGGWAAVALSADSKIVGVGTACAGTSAYGARIEALASCIVAANALCWTDSTIDPNGKPQSKDQNHSFDLGWFAQALLTMGGFRPGIADGDFGPSSTAALEAFQTAIGRQPDGVVSDEIVDRLLDATGGIGRFVPSIKSAVVTPRAAQATANTYASAAAPAKTLSMADELAAATPDEQRLAVATILSVQKTKCAVPAQAAVAVAGGDGTAWNVTCAEGKYTLILGDGATVITPGFATVAASDGTAAPSPQAVSPQGTPAPPASSAAAQAPAIGALPPLGAPAASPAPQKITGFVSGAGLQATCPVNAPNYTACIAYVQGVVDAFTTMAATDGRSPGFCLPDGETGPMLVQLLDDYMTSHPEVQQVVGAAVVLQALTEKSPCKGQ